jgi:hypothetical protein
MRLRRKETPLVPPAARRRGPRAVLAALVLAAMPAASAPVAAAALPALDFAPHSASAHLRPGDVGGIRNATSTNWAGYAAHSTKYTSVTATWSEPSASCGSSTSYASFWTGLDGYASASVEQTGTLVECSGGSAIQSAWYEMYPAAPVFFSNTLVAGDRITATVSATSSGAFTLTLTDSTRGWSHTIHQTNASLARSSAEVIAEAPSSSHGVLPLANFGTVTFSAAGVNGGTLGASSPTSITMASGSTTKASVSGISGGTSFSSTWHHS